MEKKKWLITGVSSGLGKALAELVMQSGDYVIGTFRKENECQSFNMQSKHNGEGIIMDLAKANSIEMAVNKILQKHPKIDVLVNNAGVGFVGAVEESSVSEIRDVFEINFFGTLQLTQLLLPSMRANKSGHIVQISSHGGIKAFAGFGVYNASKFALEGMSEALAQEINPLGIKLSIVEPGPFRTNFAGAGLGEAKTTIDDYANSAGSFRAMLKSVDGKQEGDPGKAARAIINLVNTGNPSLRIPLGKTALKTIAMKLESVRSDLEYNKEIAEQAVFE